MTDPEVLIPARQGRAVQVARGAAIDVVNTHGTQVVDFWALCSPDTSEHLSMEHTRIAIGRLMPRVGDTLVSNARRPMLTVVADTSPALVGRRIEVATALFGAWSGGDLDGPRRYFAEDGVLYDIIGGEYRGWPAIRAYFGRGRQRYPDLVLEPTGDFWSRPDGLAMLWTMSATQAADNLGPELVGRRWTVEGMSYLIFDGLTVVREADYHDAGSRERSLRER